MISPEMLVQTYQKGLQYLNLFNLWLLTTDKTSLGQLAFELNKRGPDNLGLCGQALLHSGFGPLQSIPVGTLLRYPTECGGVDVGQVLRVAGTIAVVAGAVGAVAFMLQLGETDYVEPIPLAYPVEGPLTRFLRYCGRDVPLAAQGANSQELDRFVAVVGAAQATAKATAPKSFSLDEVERQRNTMEFILAAFRMPVRLMAAALDSSIYFVSLTTVVVTKAIVEIIRQLTGAAEVEVVPSQNPDYPEAVGIKIGFPE